MANNFSELREPMSPESQASSLRKAIRLVLDVNELSQEDITQIMETKMTSEHNHLNAELDDD